MTASNTTMVFASPATDEETDKLAASDPAVPWQTVVWDDPVNLMSYVVRVFREYFGFSHEKATQLMLAVHNDGHAVVAEGPREQMELHAQAMHDYGLSATVRKAPR
ncbi:ATP-dependent Clp protease adaptor protein ClpS [Microbacterium amylolyticum]|uniref:ATP-dependent Clp protease adapter protein ClpS n=2 Tax=Microbacterium amylolyticum TaxID=936337 RepID=A0ABS4ZEL7_9MICO|nr:ATP-dependent Clp protease adapter ClpS [Microbacterium amylolyticum]MBP2435732.1 ATP-dependent Clp protease adaptor protein ClpS [Microbacterium amylolyticum]